MTQIPADDLCECVRCGRMHRHLGTPPWALSPDDLCRLSVLFGSATDYRTTQDQRINDWLKRLLSSRPPDAQQLVSGGANRLP